MDLLWQINFEEMPSGLIVTAFIILLNASVVVVCSMVMFPLIDLAFKKKAKPTPTPAPIETWQQDGLTAHAWLSGRPWLAMRSDYLRPDAVPHPPLAAEGMAQHALAHPQLEHITPFIIRSLMAKVSEGAPTGPVTAPSTPLSSNSGPASKTLSSEELFSAKRRPGPPDDPNKEEPGRLSSAA
jgi:hypothetical protein